MEYNGEVLTYYRELYNYNIYDICEILCLSYDHVEEIENSDCDDWELIQRYCHILQIDSLLLMDKSWQPPTKIRELQIIHRCDDYYVFVAKDDLRIKFEISKDDLLEFVDDIIYELAY